MTRSAPLLALVLAVVAAGLALKIVRYSERGNSAVADAHALVSKVMTAHGWAAVAAGGREVENLYAPITFVRSECANPVVVAVMGGNAEGAEFFRLQHGGDAGFLQQQVVASPSGLERHWSSLAQFLQRLTGSGGRQTLPVLAIAPAPPADATPCGGPPAAAWGEAR